MPLLNDNLTRANPYTNHLRYAVDSFELCPEQPCLRVRYMLPGLTYSPDVDATRIAPSPKLAPPLSQSTTASQKCSRSNANWEQSTS